jgi:phage-related protein
MAVVGEARIIVRAITNRVKPDIEAAFAGLDRIGEREGARISEGFNRGLKRNTDNDLFSRAFLASAEQARQTLNRLVTVGYFLGPAISGVVGAIGSLGAGFVSLVAVLGAATPALAAIPALLASIGLAALTARLAFSGVAAALQAGIKAQKGGASTAKAVESAEKRLAKARLNLARILEDRPDQEKAIKDSVKDAADSAADAALQETRAQKTYVDAQKRTKRALEDLNEARAEAVEKIQQLRFEVEGGAISEKKARLEFEKARDALQRVQDLPPNSRARQEAELAFAEADLNLRKAIDRNKDLKKEEAAATKAGVEGSKEVKAARDAVAEALYNEQQSGIDAAKARKDAAKAQADAVKAAEDLESGKAFKDIDRQLADAREAVKEAEKDLGEAKKGGSAFDAYNDALKNLSPEAQKFVKYLLSIRGEFKKLRDAAGKNLFPALEIAIDNLVKNLFPQLIPLLETLGGKLGGFAIKLSKAFTTPQNIRNIKAIFKDTGDEIDILGDIAADLTGIILALWRAAGPLVKRFLKWVETLTSSWEMSLNTEKGIADMTKRFKKAGDVMARLGGIFGNLKDAFVEIGKAVMDGGAGDFLLTYFEDATKSFADLMKDMNKDGSLGKYFLDATENATKVLSLLGNIVAEVLKLGDDEGVGKFVDSLSRAVDTFGSIGGELNKAAPKLGEFVEKFATLILNLTQSGAIDTFFTVINKALDIANVIFGNSAVQKILGYVVTVFAVSRAFGVLGKVGGFAFKSIVGSIVRPFNQIKAFRDTIKKIPGAWDTLRLKGMYAMDSIRSGWGKVTTAASTAKAGMIKAFQAAGQKISTAATAGLNGLKSAFSTLGTAAKTAAIAVGNALKKMALAVGRAIMTIGRFLMANPWILLIVALVAIVVLIIKNWDKIKEIVGNAVQWVGEKVGAAWDWIKEKTAAIWDGIVSFFTELPGKLLNAIQSLATTVLDFISKYHPIAILWRLITENWESIRTWFTELPGKIVEAVKGLATTVFEFINKYHPIAIMFRLVKENWTEIKTWFTELPGKITSAIGGLATTVKTFIATNNPITLLLNKVKEVWPTVSSFLSQKMTDIVTFVKGLPSRIASAAKGMWDGITGAFKSAINSIIRGWNKIEFKVPGFKIGPIGYKGFTLGLPDIPELAAGGVVPATPGGTLARIAEAGRPERVEPLDPSGLSARDRAIIDRLSGGPEKQPVTVNVYPSAGMDERELAELVSRKMASLMRRGAA